MSEGIRTGRPKAAYVITNQADNGFVYEMMRGIADALTRAGIPARIQVFSTLSDIVGAIDDILDDPAFPDILVVDYLGHSRFYLMRALSPNKTRAGVQFFHFYSDPPFNNIDTLGILPAHSLVGYADRNHRPFFEAFPVKARLTFFPHAGPAPDEDAPLAKDRPIPLLFVGNLLHSPHPEALDPIRALAPRREIAERTIERMLLGGEEPFAALRQSYADFGVEIEIASACKLAVAVRNWVESRLRHDLIVSLRGLPLTVCGHVDGGFFRQSMDAVNFRGLTTTTNCIALMRQARLVINSTADRPAGAHERIWYAMANGAALLTDRSEILAEDFEPGRHVFFLPPALRAVRGMVSDLLANPALDEASSLAMPIYARTHTWDARIAGLLQNLP